MSENKNVDPFPGTFTQHFYDYDAAKGGATYVNLPDRRCYGLSVTSEKDQYSRKFGRALAFKRASIAESMAMNGVVIVVPDVNPAIEYYKLWTSYVWANMALDEIIQKAKAQNPGAMITIITEQEARDAVAQMGMLV